MLLDAVQTRSYVPRARQPRRSRTEAGPGSPGADPVAVPPVSRAGARPAGLTSPSAVRPPA
ncbi:hypothetical protein XF36_18530 [Pseudonocardia sp. HH130629-09]|nr:hypothetical protein XF36_18530 [Pseudonocardia sp. HH130629-09]